MYVVSAPIRQGEPRAHRARSRRTASPPPADPREAARAAHLRYVTDTGPGITRRRSGKGFAYRQPNGAPLRDPETLRRIRSLVIPPAWTDVWISPLPDGHIQVSGRDTRGRKQYCYHPRWREVRDETKYDRLVSFCEALPRIRDRINGDLASRGMPREKVLATVVRLLEMTLMRVGNEEYARRNDSYGLTTLRNRHVDVHGSTVRFHFRGKSGIEHAVSLRDRRVAAVLKRCQALPGQELFQYLDEEGARHSISSGDVNDYLRDVSGEEITAKDFRTWAGTVLMFLTLRDCQPCASETAAKKNVAAAVKQVSQRLGNTPAVCRKCYVHPAVIEAYLGPQTREALQGALDESASDNGLRPEEEAVLRFLTGWAARRQS